MNKGLSSLCLNTVSASFPPRSFHPPLHSCIPSSTSTSCSVSSRAALGTCVSSRFCSLSPLAPAYMLPHLFFVLPQRPGVTAMDQDPAARGAVQTPNLSPLSPFFFLPSCIPSLPTRLACLLSCRSTQCRLLALGKLLLHVTAPWWPRCIEAAGPVPMPGG